MLASGTQVCGFSGVTILSMPSSAGEEKNLSHVPALRHVKEPSNLRELQIASQIPGIVPSFASRGLSRRLVCAAPQR